ncbi:hypothetical protein JCM9279_003033 [Rhodotorula babjevae]
MSTRSLFASTSRALPPARRRALHTSQPRYVPQSGDPQDAHGSAPSSARRLRPRDRLQFTEASGAAGTDSAPLASQEGAAAAGPPVVPSPPSTSSSARTSSSTLGSSPSNPDSPAATVGELIISAPLEGLPPLERHALPLSRVPFSTHRFVRDLEGAGVPRPLATDLMKATRDLLLQQEEKAQSEVLSRQELENEAYLFTAALNELKTGSQVRSRNDSITLRSLTASLQRETDGLEQKMKEDMQRLGSDIQLEMNARKEETSQELTQLDKRVMDLNSKFTILLGEARTEIEATKWISTRRVMSAITVFVVSVVAYYSISTSSRKRSPKPDKPPSIEDLGLQLGTNLDEAEMALGEVGSAAAAAAAAAAPSKGGGWSFWPAAPAKGKRVGAEEAEEET